MQLDCMYLYLAILDVDPEYCYKNLSEPSPPLRRSSRKSVHKMLRFTYAES